MDMSEVMSRLYVACATPPPPESPWKQPVATPVGLPRPADLSQMEHAWREWARSDAALFAFAWAGATGHKPATN